MKWHLLFASLILLGSCSTNSGGRVGRGGSEVEIRPSDLMKVTYIRFNFDQKKKRYYPVYQILISETWKRKYGSSPVEPYSKLFPKRGEHTPYFGIVPDSIMRSFQRKLYREGLSDLASVDAAFDDTPIRSRYAGVAGSGATGTITVYKTGDQDAVDIARMVRAYAAGRRDAADRDQPRLTWGWFERFAASVYASSDGKIDLRNSAQKAYEIGYSAPGVLPDQIDLSISSDLARFIEGRIDLLARNAAMGGVLVTRITRPSHAW